MEEITNADRAQWALSAIEDFVGSTRVDTASDAIHDLIADLLHLAQGRGLDAHQLVTSASLAMAVEQEGDAEGDMESVQRKFRDLLDFDK